MFRTGSPTNPQANDRSFVTEDEAVEVAVKESGETQVIAVWSGPEDGDRILALAFQGQLFRS